jgi:hypothetical protein
MAAAVAEQFGLGVGAGEGEVRFDADGVGVARDGAADGPVLTAGVAVGDPVAPGLGAADRADVTLPRGGWMLIPRASKS